MLNIVYCGNDKIFKGLYLSILSILKRTKENITFYFLTGDLQEIDKSYTPLSQKHIQIIKELVTSFSKTNSFIVYDCAKYYKDSFSNMDVKKWTPYSAFKLFIDKFNYTNDVILYLDTDTLINGDIKQAFDVDMKDTELCVCRLAQIAEIFGARTIFFNVGSMLMNVPYIKQTNLLTKAIDYYKKYKLPYNEETALNATASKIKFWPKEERFNYQLRDIEKDTVVKHFSGYIGNVLVYPIKPWDISAVQKWLEIHNWDEDYDFFKKEMNRLGEKL